MDTERELLQHADALGDGAEDQTDNLEQRQRIKSEQKAAIHELQEKDQHNSAHDAAMAGDIDCLKTLLDKGIDPMSRTSTKETMLHIAARYKHRGIVDFLCKSYPDLRYIRNEIQWNAAHYAAGGGGIDCLQTLIDHGIDPMSRTSTQETLLHVAARYKHIGIVNFLCKTYPYILHMRDTNEWDGAHYATMGGDLDCLKILIHYGIYPMSRTSTQETLLHLAVRYKHRGIIDFLCKSYPGMLQLTDTNELNTVHYAAMDGDIDCLKTLIAHGIDPMSRTSTQETLLHLAVRYKHRVIVDFLCKSYPVMLQMTDTNEWNAVHYAAMGGDIDCLKTLIDHGIDPMSRTSTQETLLHLAVRYKHRGIVDFLCKSYPGMLQMTDTNEWNAVHYAAMGGDIDYLKTLIDHGIDPMSRTSTQETLLHLAYRYEHRVIVDFLCKSYPGMLQMTDTNEWNAVHYAAMGGDIDCLKTLIDHGIDPMSRTSTQETLLHLAVRYKHRGIVDFLCKSYPGMLQMTDTNEWNAVHYAAMGGYIGCLKTLIDHGIDPMARTSTQETLLHLAYRYEHREIVDFLCKSYPCMLHMTDSNRWNAAHYAAMEGDINRLKTLIGHGIDPLSRTSTQETLLHLAARYKHRGIVVFLCTSYPYMLHMTDSNRWNAAHYAAMGGDIGCLNTLIYHGIGPMSRTSSQETLLHVAARWKHRNTLQYLCTRYPVLIQLMDKKQWNAAHYAAMGGDIDCLETLIDHGIDPMSRTSTQETLLHVAARYKHSEIVEHLREKYHTMAGDTVIESENYNNFLKVGLALRKLQTCLIPFITRELQTIHASALANIGGPYCGTCTTNNILLHPRRNCKRVGCVCWDDQKMSRRSCPTEGCKRFYDVLVQLNGHGTPQMHNVDISTMFHDPWQIGKSFLPPSGYATIASANDCDVLGLCSIIINCKHFGISFDRADVFSQVQDISLDIMHSAVQEVTEHDTNLKLNTLVQALQCGPLNHDEDAKRAATEIMKMRNSTHSRHMGTYVKQELLKTKKEAIENKLKAMEKTEDITRKALEMSLDERQKATIACVADLQMEIDKSQTAKSKSSNKKTIFGKPFDQSCILDGENTTFQIPGSDVKVIFPNSLTTNTRIEVHGSSFPSISHIRKRFDLPTSEEIASPVTEYHVTGCTWFSDYTCVKVPFVGPRSEVKVWKFLSDEGITNTTIRLQVPLKGKYSNEHLFYEVEGESTCSVYTRSFSGFFCTTDGHRPLKLRALLYASHKRFQPLSQHEVRIRMYIADEVMKFQDYKQTMDDIETMQYRFQKEDKVLSLLEDGLTEDSNIEVCVTPTGGSSNQWMHEPNPHTGQPICAEIQMLPLRDIVQKCPDCPGCHLQSKEIPYYVEWYLISRHNVLPSLRFKGLVTVDCVNNEQRRSTPLIIDELLLRPEDRLPAEENGECDRLPHIKGFVMRMADDKRQTLLEFFGLGPTFVNRLFDDLQHHYKPAGVYRRLVKAFSKQLLYEDLDRLFDSGLIPEKYCQRPIQRVAEGAHAIPFM